MKAMVMKGVAAALSPLEGALPLSRNASRAVLRPPKQAGLPAAQPPEAEDSEPNALEPTIYRFILSHSLSQQLVLILFTLISFPFLYLSLDLPKTIINRAIRGKQFPQHLFGFDFSQVTYLLILCGFF
jgi:hypothetical protein